jgi:hypothetical protein
MIYLPTIWDVLPEMVLDKKNRGLIVFGILILEKEELTFLPWFAALYEKIQNTIKQ